MGGCLGKRGPPPPPAEGGAGLPQGPVTRQPSQALHQLHRVQHVHRAHPAPRLRPGRRPRDWDPANPASWVANEAWRRFPMRRPQNSIVGPLPSDWWESYLKRTLWSLRHPRAAWSPVTIRITPPAQTSRSAGASASEKPPDPRATETVLSVLRESQQARLRLEEPPPQAPERPDRRRGSPEARASAFKPLGRSGNLASFVPSLGPLSLGLGLKKRPSSCSLSSVASAHPARPLGSKRNAITSSYSSARGLSEPCKRRRAPLQTPEWPVKRKSGLQRPVPGPLAAEEPPTAPGSPRPRGEETPRLLADPGPPLAPSPPLPRGSAVPAEDLASGTEAGLRRSNHAKKDARDAAADPAPGALPSLSRTLSPAGTAPAGGTGPPVASSPPRASPMSAGEGTSVVHPPLETPRLLAPLRCSRPEPRPGPSAGSEPTAAVTLLTPVPPTSSATDTTRPPSACPADTSPRPPGPPAITPTAPSTERTVFGVVRGPAHHLSASAPPAAVSADPASKPSWKPPPNNEAGVSLPSRISATTAARSPPGLSTPTFKPIFGSIEPLKARPVIAPFSFKQISPPGSPAATHLFHHLGKTSSIATSTSPDRTHTDSSFKPPRDFGGAGVTRTVGSTYSDPSPSHTFLLGASHAFRANFSNPVTGFIFPAPPLSTIPMVNAGNIFSQVLPSTVQISPRKSTAHFKGKGSPLSASALVTPSQPTLSSGTSNPTSALTVSLGSSSKPLFPLSLGVTPQPAFGASGGPRQGAHQPALSPSFKSSSVLGSSAVVSSTPTPAPAQPAFSSPTRSAFRVLTPSASTFHTGAGRTPAGFPFGPASATGFGVVPQTRQSGPQTSVFGSTAPRPFAFGGLVTPMDCGESGDSMTVPDMTSNSGVFSIGAMPSGATHIITPFGKGWSQNIQGLTPQNTPFALGRPSISTRKIMFGGPPMAPLAHSLPAPRPVKTGSSFVLGIPSPPAQGSLGRGSFRSAVPSFSIGAKPKTPKNREPGHSRRHHAHKK